MSHSCKFEKYFFPFHVLPYLIKRKHGKRHSFLTLSSSFYSGWGLDSNFIFISNCNCRFEAQKNKRTGNARQEFSSLSALEIETLRRNENETLSFLNNPLKIHLFAILFCLLEGAVGLRFLWFSLLYHFFIIFTSHSKTRPLLNCEMIL